MENNTSEKEKKLERIRNALKWKFGDIEDYIESDIKIGVAVTSLYQFKPVGEAYSKCFMPELYDGHPQLSPEYIAMNKERHGYESDKLLEDEEKAIKNLNQISAVETNAQSYPRDYSKPVKLAPDWYGRINEEKRIFLEPIISKSSTLISPTYRQKFVEFDKAIYELDNKKGSDEQLNQELSKKIIQLEKDKEWNKGVGLFYVARFHHLCNKYIELFKKNFKNRSDEEIKSKQTRYLINMLTDYHPDVTKENLAAYLKKEKKLSIENIVDDFLERRAEYATKYPKHAATLIHGDFGTHHINLDGICFDFDELRLDMPQDDIVRFLNNEFTGYVREKVRDAGERKMPKYLASYIINRKRFEKKIEWEDDPANTRIEDIFSKYSKNNLEEECMDFLLAYYRERIEEDIHLYSVNKAAGEERLKIFSEGHPIFQTLEQFQKFRIDDINRVLSFLLGTRAGRKTILKEGTEEGRRNINFFETMRKFFEKSGIMEERFGESDGGLYDY